MGRRAKIYEDEVEVKEPEILTKITINLYKPDNDLVITHKPEVIYEGELISMKMCDTIHFHLRKTLRRYKIDLNAKNKIIEGEAKDE